MHDVENVLGDTGFWAALIVSGLGTAFVWLRTRQREVTPGIALVVAVAGLVGWRSVHGVPDALVIGLGLLALGEWLTRREPSVPRVVALVPGAVILGAALPDGWPFWMRVVAAAGAVVAGILTVDADRRAPRLVPALLAIGAVGVYFCVPDTEAPKVLLGALLAAAVIGLEPRLSHTVGFSAAVGLFVWAVVLGGMGRDGSVVGGLGCLGVAALLPFVGRWWPRRSTVVTAVVVQVALVVYESRVAGREVSAWAALALSVPAFVVGWAVLRASRGR